MKTKIMVAGALFVAAAVTFTALVLLMSGPHMFQQKHIRTYAAAMPLPPPGAVPLNPAYEPIPSQKEARELTNPIVAGEAALAIGKTYYEYYCIFCHGAVGKPDTPVARGYVPAPSDLTTQKVRTMPDGELLRAMLTGEGHEPVLEQVVPAEARWYIVLYVKRLASGQGVTPAEWPKSPAAVPRLESSD